ERSAGVRVKHFSNLHTNASPKSKLHKTQSAKAQSDKTQSDKLQSDKVQSDKVQADVPADLHGQQ
ncbi:MAG TPA: hypothetical protein VGG12_07400, partial [Methylovirgula sp.]